MKIRCGFVSNSSSSSFVIGKAYMNEEQIKKFLELIKEVNKQHGVPCFSLYGYADTYDDTADYSVWESDYYFHGYGDNSANTYLISFFKEIDIYKYMYFDEI